MIPKLELKWSWIYEQEIHTPFIKSKTDIEKKQRYINNFIKELKKKWQPINDKVLNFMAKRTGLKWKVKRIPCYIIKISTKGPISDPLTIPIQLKIKKRIFSLTINRFIDMLIHELIHNLFIQNKKLDRYFNYLINKKYKKEKWNVAIHVPVHAIHKEIFLKFFDEKRLDIEKKMCEYYPDYKRAWEIVEKEGSENIIKELRSFS